MSVVMGIDASTTCTGISIFNNKNLVYSTEIRAKSDEWHQRLIEQKDQIEEIIKKYEPIMAYMEDVPLESRSSKNLLLLGAVHGFIFDICINFDIKIEYSEITNVEFDQKLTKHITELNKLFEQSKKFEVELTQRLGKIKYEE